MRLRDRCWSLLWLSSSDPVAIVSTALPCSDSLREAKLLSAITAEVGSVVRIRGMTHPDTFLEDRNDGRSWPLTKPLRGWLVSGTTARQKIKFRLSREFGTISGRQKQKWMVPTRVELATLALLAPRSNRLSYRTRIYCIGLFV